MIEISEQCKSANQTPGTLGFGTQDQILGGIFFTFDSLLFCRKAQIIGKLFRYPLRNCAFLKRGCLLQDFTFHDREKVLILASHDLYCHADLYYGIMKG